MKRMLEDSDYWSLEDVVEVTPTSSLTFALKQFLKLIYP